MIAVLRRSPRLIKRLRAHATDDFGVSALVWHELFYGAYRSQRVEHHLSQVDGLPLQVMEFDREDARRAGQVRAELAQAGAPIGPIDVLIAGQGPGAGPDPDHSQCG